jgi:hypothetical protein
MTSTSFSSTYYTATDDLLATGEAPIFDPAKVRYVCHTSSIPLATTVDEQFILRPQSRTCELTHSIKYVDEEIAQMIPYKCCKVHCMYSDARNQNTAEILRDNCPCNKIEWSEFDSTGEEVTFSLQPLCFLQVIKETRYSLGYVDTSVECSTDSECCHNQHPSTRPRIDYQEVMFCQNSQSILDESYSKPLRDKLNVPRWDNITDPEKFLETFDCLYWFRKHATRSTRKLIFRLAEEGAKRFRRTIAQVFHTLNGLIIKKLLTFPIEIEGYEKLAMQTAALFAALVRDYFVVPGDDNLPAVPENSVFLRAKNAFKAIKECFTSDSLQKRLMVFEIFQKDPKCIITRFFAGCLKRLRKVVVSMTSDYSSSVGWIIRMSHFAQTRNMGYLPEWIAIQKRKAFRDIIARDKVEIPKEDIEWIKRIIPIQANKAGIPANVLNPDIYGLNEILREAILSIDVPLKGNASVNSTVHEGGKLEDARQLLSTAIRGSWKIPVRNLRTGEVIEEINFNESMRLELKPPHGYLFWVALQIALEWLSIHYPVYEIHRRELPDKEQWINEFDKMSIVHISEPAKERNLTKSSSLLAWVLTLCSKVSQSVLSQAQDHRAGLVLSAQDWMHQRRVSAESFESYFIYDPNTGLRRDTVWNGFQDWTESTDYIPRRVGGTALFAWLRHIGFPRWFAGIIVQLGSINFEVTEVVSRTWIDDQVQITRYSGVCTEGFMMGNPITKTVLHLMHDINIGTAQALLKRLGVETPSWASVYEHEASSREPQGSLSINPRDIV